MTSVFRYLAEMHCNVKITVETLHVLSLYVVTDAPNERLSKGSDLILDTAPREVSLVIHFCRHTLIKSHFMRTYAIRSHSDTESNS